MTTRTRMEVLKKRLRSHGLPLTIQRRTVFAGLEHRTDHPTAEQIFAFTREKIPGVSRTTVYRVLETLVRLGMARKVDHPGAAARFDPRTDHHHHLICLGCQRVQDHDHPRHERPAVPSFEETGFQISDYSIHYVGTCSECLAEGQPETTGGKT
jgi:Fur family peroxide stress response transcriptional regulator